MNADPFTARDESAEPDPDIGLAKPIRDHSLLLLVERFEDRRIDPLVRADDDRPSSAAARARL